jgi:hypothetical protein
MASPPSHIQALLPDPSCLKLNSVEHQVDGRVPIAAAAIGSELSQSGPDFSAGLTLKAIWISRSRARLAVTSWPGSPLVLLLPLPVS